MSRGNHRKLTADDYVSLTPIATPMDVALDRAFKTLGIPRLGGASGRGWSSNAVFLSCPRRLQLSTLRKKKIGEVVDSEGRAVGAAYHAMLALYYLPLIEKEAAPEITDASLVEETPEVVDALPTAALLRDALYDEKACAPWVSEAWRLYHYYTSRYEQDYIRPLAVEHWIEGKVDTARYDLIVEVLPNEQGIVPGIYNVDHKTSASNNETFRTGWTNDPEFLTQLLVWKEAKLDKVFGPLKGVIMNGIVKTQSPQVHRFSMAPNWRAVKEWERELRVTQAERAHCAATGYYPMRGRAHGCVFRYGKCEHYEECAR